MAAQVYGSWPAWPCGGGRGLPELLIELAAERGLRFAVRPPCVESPSWCMDSGLLILSRWPIAEQQALSFKRQFFFEKFGANRGALFGSIELPRSRAGGRAHSRLHFFTCHICPSYKALMPFAPAAFQRWADGVRTSQFDELARFVEGRWDRAAGGCATAGDFNAHLDTTSTLSSPKRRALGLRMAHRAMASAGLRDASEGQWCPTFGYPGQERLLTSSKQRNLSFLEDLIFLDVESAARMGNARPRPVSMSMAACAPPKGEGLEAQSLLAAEPPPDDSGAAAGWTHISDHWGVELELPPAVSPAPTAERASSPTSLYGAPNPRDKAKLKSFASASSAPDLERFAAVWP